MLNVGSVSYKTICTYCWQSK